MAITIKMTGYCKKCPHAALTLDSVFLTDISNPYAMNKEWHISCEHEYACERIFKGRIHEEDDLK